MFRDEAVIRVRAGRGGRGIVSFRREKYVPRGGPDGGDGGRGGSVVLEAREGLSSLYDLAHTPLLKAENGRSGEGGNRTGRSGKDLVIPVPVGTQVFALPRENLLKDLDRPGARLVAARGGRGGRGNARFATPERRAPRIAEEGEPGEERELKLVLKLIADVGLVGLPNAGKSTLLSRLSAARPKVADYPFTTLAPVLGIVELDRSRTFVMADLPGLIEGAHRGAGLGDRFLKHVERTRILLHLVDCSSGAPDPVEAFDVIRRELEAFSKVLSAKEWIPAATKMDDPSGEERAARLEKGLGKPVLRISSVTGLGLEALLGALGERLFGD